MTLNNPDNDALLAKESHITITEASLAEIPETVITRTDPSKLVYLESIRVYIQITQGVAALVVVIQHFIQSISPSYSGDWVKYQEYLHLYHVLYNGYIAVSLFFLLTGRVLTLSILKKGCTVEAIKSLGSAIFRRPLRLGIPVLAGTVIGQFLLHLNIFNITEYHTKILGIKHAFLKPPLPFKSIPHFFAFVFSFLGGLPINADHYATPAVIWTIPVELSGSFYLFLITLILICIPSHSHKSLFLGIVFLSLWWMNSWNVLFVAGLWIAQLSISGLFTKVMQHRFTWILRIIIAILALALLTRELPLFDFINSFQSYQILSKWGQEAHFGDGVGYSVTSRRVQMNAVTLSSILILVLFEITPLLQRAFSTPVVRFMGVISFGMYLAHPFILSGLVPYLVCATQGWYLWAVHFFCFIVYLGLSIVCGWGFHLLFDKPAIQISHWMFGMVARKIDSGKSL